MISFKDAETKKPIGYDKLSSNAIIDVSDSIKVNLFKIFKAYLEEAVFPEVIAVFKKSEKEKNVENYRPISILPKYFNVLIACMNIS